MTLLSGFGDDDAQFIVADAALTSSVAPQGEPSTSSFGETHTSTDRGYVREATIKLFRLGNVCIGGYCGLVSAGVPGLRRLRDRLPFVPLTDAIQEVQDSLRGATLIVAARDSIGAMRRWIIDEDRIVEEYLPGTLCVLGSAAPQQRDFVASSLQEMLSVPDIRCNRHHILATLTVSLQAYGQRVNLLPHGIGGTIWGLGVASDGIIEQRDIMYILFDRDDSAPAGINIDTLSAVLSGQRQHIAFAWRLREYPSGLRVFVGDVTFVSDGEIREFAQALRKSQPYYLAFVERRTGSVAVCARDDLKDDGLFRVSYDGALKVTLNAIVEPHLRAFPVAGETMPAEVPFAFIS